MNAPYPVEALAASVRRLVRAHEKYTSAKRSYFGDEPLFMREAHMIMAAGTLPFPTMSAVAQALGVTPGAVSQLAKRLEDKGYITRSIGLEDKRQFCISLTEKGETFFRHHQAYDRQKLEETREALSQYTNEELLHFIEMQDEMARLLEMELTSTPPEK